MKIYIVSGFKNIPGDSYGEKFTLVYVSENEVKDVLINPLVEIDGVYELEAREYYVSCLIKK